MLKVSFWEKLKIRKAFETETTDDDKAANLLLTILKDGKNTFVVNAAIGITMGSPFGFQVMSKLVNVRRAGLKPKSG